MTNPSLLRPKKNTTGLLVIDIQEKFRPAISAFDAVAHQAATLIRASGILALPVFATEQYPEGLGATVKPVAGALPPDAVIFAKKSFSCCGEGDLAERIRRTGVSAIALCGVETHVCVYQTALDLISQGFTVVAIADAMASRNAYDHEIALRRIERAGGIIMTVEMFLFDLVETAGSPDFKAIQKLVK